MMSVKEASRELRVSARQILRIKNRFREEGEQGVISRRRGKPNVRKIPKEVRERALKVLADPVGNLTALRYVYAQNNQITDISNIPASVRNRIQYSA